MARMRTIAEVDVQDRKAKERLKASYEWYKAHGICVKCHKEDALPGKVYCAVCTAMTAERNRARLKRCEEQGLCKRCGRPLMAEDAGHKMCAKCRAYVSAYNKLYYNRKTRKKRKKRADKKK